MRGALRIGIIGIIATLVAVHARAQVHDATVAGAPISIDVKDAAVTDLLRLFARIGDVNIVVDPAASGKTITLRLDEVPWEQALALVLQTSGLAAIHEGNVLRVAPHARLVAEEGQVVQLREAREQSGEPSTIAIPLSNANAAQVEAIVRKSLTARGSTSVDRRTNTLLVTDVFPGLPSAGGVFEFAPSLGFVGEDAGSVSFDVRLYDVSGSAASVPAADLPNLPNARLVDAAKIVLGVGQRIDVVLGASDDTMAQRLTLSPQKDGRRTALAMRATPVGSARGGGVVARSVPLGRPEFVVLPRSHGAAAGHSLVLAFAPM